MKSKLGLMLGLLGCLGALGCASAPVSQLEVRRSNEGYERMRKTLQQNDRVVPGNTISVDHAGDSKISGEYKLDFDGKVQMPYKVTVKAGGLTIAELKESIQKAYQDYVKGDPLVKVEVKERNVWVEARGEVKNPGRYLVRLDMSLEEIVAKAGGFVNEQAGAPGSAGQRPEYLRIERAPSEGGAAESVWFQLAEYFSQYDTEPDLLWRGGEKIYFQMTAPPDANIKKNWHTISVMGEVREAKDLPILPNGDLLTYIGRSGGPTSNADFSRVEIIHRATNQRQTVNLISDRLMGELKAGDVVVVRALDNSPSFVDRFLTYVISLSMITISAVTLMLL